LAGRLREGVIVEHVDHAGWGAGVTKIELRAEQTYARPRGRAGRRSSDVFAHERERVLDPTRPEGVHKMRVASRRLRAALEIFAPAFPHKPLRTALAEVKLLAAALGKRRDRDVQIELLESLREMDAAASARRSTICSRSAPRAGALRTSTSPARSSTPTTRGSRSDCGDLRGESASDW